MMTTSVFDLIELAEEPDDGEFTAPDGFVVDDDETLGWMLRRISSAKERIAERSLTAEKHRDKLRYEIQRVTEWEARVNRYDHAQVAHFELCATEYLRVQHEQGSKAKSLSTPYGKVKSREQQPEFFRDDEKALLEWAGEHGYTKAKIEVDWAALKDAAVVRGNRMVDAETGELIPGVTVKERGKSYTVETS